MIGNFHFTEKIPLKGFIEIHSNSMYAKKKMHLGSFI